MTDPERQASEAGGERAIELLAELIRRPSVTPDDAGCQQLLAHRLERLGFACESMPHGDVSNLWARRGDTGPVLCFAGHTDVVPAGDLDNWTTDPFEPVMVDGFMHGRGAADMKGGLVAMLLAVEQFLSGNADHQGSIAFLITSDEEGPAVDGTRKVLEALSARGEKIDYCVVGEPSSSDRLGDVIRIGRRGSLSGLLEIKGIQGHVAYPQHADNPIHRFAPVLNEFHDKIWDQGNASFPPTSMQIVDLRAGAGAANVIPSSLTAQFNFRYSNEWTHLSLQQEVEGVLQAHDLDYSLQWTLYGEPYLTGPGALIDAVVAAVTGQTGNPPELSTGGGTSDGRFISPTGAQVVELGLINASVHKANECVRVDDIGKLAAIYANLITRLLCD